MIEHPRMAIQHMAGPSRIRPTRPPDAERAERFGAVGASFDVAAWGTIAVAA